jgi:hypothetical protein
MVELKGGGDAVSAARAVIQTGDFDFAWNTQVEDEVLLKLENSPNAKGRVDIVSGIQINTTDPWTEVDGECSSVKTKHPLFSDPAVVHAFGLLVDWASDRGLEHEPQPPSFFRANAVRPALPASLVQQVVGLVDTELPFRNRGTWSSCNERDERLARRSPWLGRRNRR